MTSHRALFPQSDERQALEQLERLHREIQNARRQRERAGAEFDGFVAGFEDPHAAPRAPRAPSPSRRPRPTAIPRALVPAPASESATPHAPSPPPPSAASSHPLPSTAPVQAAPASPPLETPTALRVAQPRSRGRTALIVAALSLAAIAGLAYLWREYLPDAADSTRSAAPQTPAPAVVLPHEDAESRPPLASPTSAPPVLQVEVATIRPVWLRATVDGHRAVERQVPAGTRMTFTPSDSISIRAGDAGAVRLKIGAGPEEPLGRDGQVLTRVVVAGSPR